MQTQVTDLIHFHGISLLVVTHENIQYVLAKPIVELAGMVWRTAKRVLITDVNVALYGSKYLPTPRNLNQYNNNITKEELRLYIRLDRARLYVIRLNNHKMLKEGKVEQANRLLKLQLEMGTSLSNDFKEQIKADRYAEKRKEIKEWLQIRNAFSPDHDEFKALTHLINQAFKEIGFPPEDAI